MRAADKYGKMGKIGGGRLARLWELLGIEKGLTAVMGSGGKTSLLYELAEELAAALAEHGAACAVSYTAEGKLTAPGFPGWETAADYVLVEADGSKRLPAKAHAAWEPVLPPQRRRTVCVLGASAFGQTIRQSAHRPALYAALAGASEEDVITPALAARVLMAEGGFDMIYVNQIDREDFDPALAGAFAQAVDCPVVVGSLRQKRWKRLR